MWNRSRFKHIDHSGDEIIAERKVIGDETNYSTDWLTDRTSSCRRGASLPMVSFPDPHQPYESREPYVSMFPQDEVKIPDSFHQADVPDWIARDRETKDFPMTETSWCTNREQRLRQLKANYCAMVKHIDDAVGRLLADLEQRGILDETIVIFTTDHGDLMGEHGMSGKNFLYEPAYRVPFVIRHPGIIPAGTNIEAMISTVDVMPTLLDLVGVAASGREEGQSAAAMIRGAQAHPDWPTRVFTHPYGYNRVACFSPEYELGYDYGGEPVLFDRRNDPQQVANLYHDPRDADIISELRSEMEAHYATTCPQVVDWLPGNHGFDTGGKV